MSEKTMENNQVSVIGKIVSDFTFSHEVFGEGFYLVDLEVNRLSGSGRCDTAYGFRTSG